MSTADDGVVHTKRPTVQGHRQTSVDCTGETVLVKNELRVAESNGDIRILTGSYFMTNYTEWLNVHKPVD